MEQSKSCFSRRGKQRKPGTWVITPTPAPSKPPPGSNQRSQGLRKNLRVPMWPQGSKDKKEARTSVQPRAHRGHYNYKNLRVPVKRSLDQNLRVPIRPQRSKYDFRKIDRTPVQLKAHQGSSYNPKNLRVPTTISGSIIESLDSYTASGLKSRSQDLEKRPPDLQNDFRRTFGLFRDLRVPRRPSGPHATSELQDQSPDSKSPYSSSKPPGL
ncbi:hypothetical protein DY000_02021595 [Brassica cretica]|uniref:Uncharacterized protein n=1 Tax=Brassica cretica TaxID=69181 RepID=A0ABQ7EEG9_BRACR|nr:hypothetical protein DY000_02021595 [Brassica cretica]